MSRALLPGVRIATREYYTGRGFGRVKYAMLMPFLPLIIMVVLQLGFDFIMRLLESWGLKDVSPQLRAMAQAWERDRLPEVAVAMVRMQQGDTGQ